MIFLCISYIWPWTSTEDVLHGCGSPYGVLCQSPPPGAAGVSTGRKRRQNRPRAQIGSSAVMDIANKVPGIDAAKGAALEKAV
jgi:hypothetical protein